MGTAAGSAGSAGSAGDKAAIEKVAGKVNVPTDLRRCEGLHRYRLLAHTDLAESNFRYLKPSSPTGVRNLLFTCSLHNCDLPKS
jgi:hypothetical protein